MNICRLVYISERNMSAGLNVQQILKTSRINNSRVGVTGFLMYDGTHFTQALEGTRNNVTHTYNRIVHDPRHTNLHLISCADVKDRLFPHWSMCLREGVSPEARERLLATFTLERINPNSVPIERILYVLQSLSAEVGTTEYRAAAE